ncbi:MAG: PDZ domain-containing protein [Myxococcota bacterium]|nr:PDZ domain-containing protein [Myxococcota bacterium]
MTARRTEYEVTHDDLRSIMSGEGGNDLEPIVEDGKQVAMRIVGVSPGSTAARLGAQNGDTITAINGVPLTSVPAAYRAADLAIRQAEIVIEGARDGEPYVTVLAMKQN